MGSCDIFSIWGGPNCPIEPTLELISRKWVIAIIRDMFVGKKHFSEFQENKPNLTNSVLSDTLKFMEMNGLVEKKVFDKTRSNTEYYLTDKSRKLNRIIYEMILYGIDVLDCDKESCDNLGEKMKENYRKLLIKDSNDLNNSEE